MPDNDPLADKATIESLENDMIQTFTQIDNMRKEIINQQSLKKQYTKHRQRLIEPHMRLRYDTNKLEESFIGVNREIAICDQKIKVLHNRLEESELKILEIEKEAQKLIELTNPISASSNLRAAEVTPTQKHEKLGLFETLTRMVGLSHIRKR
jgi:chromosome segregation ATPase